MSKLNTDIIANYFPELDAGGFTRNDGTIEFFDRIQALIDEQMTILDFGAGRGAWYEYNYSEYRKNKQCLKGKVKKVIGCDIDEAVFKNKSLDEAVISEIGKPLPFDDETFDLIVSDYTFEHVANPDEVSKELSRILKPGGWICARTPNKYSYVSIMTRLIKNKHHSKLLKRIQPEREDIDVFPTVFKLNTKHDIAKHFNSKKFDNFTYRYDPEPAYFFNSNILFGFLLFVNKLLPPFFYSNYFIFLRKKN